MLVRKGLLTVEKLDLIRHGTKSHAVVTGMRTTGPPARTPEVELDVMVRRPKAGSFPPMRGTDPGVVADADFPRQHHRHVLPIGRRVCGGRLRAAKLITGAVDGEGGQRRPVQRAGGEVAVAPPTHLLALPAVHRAAGVSSCARSTAMIASAIGSRSPAVTELAVSGRGRRRPQRGRTSCAPPRIIAATKPGRLVELVVAAGCAGHQRDAGRHRQLPTSDPPRSAAGRRPDAPPPGRRGRRRRPRRSRGRRQQPARLRVQLVGQPGTVGIGASKQLTDTTTSNSTSLRVSQFREMPGQGVSADGLPSPNPAANPVLARHSWVEDQQRRPVAPIPPSYRAPGEWRCWAARPSTRRRVRPVAAASPGPEFSKPTPSTARWPAARSARRTARARRAAACSVISPAIRPAGISCAPRMSARSRPGSRELGDGTFDRPSRELSLRCLGSGRDSRSRIVPSAAPSSITHVTVVFGAPISPRRRGGDADVGAAQHQGGRTLRLPDPSAVTWRPYRWWASSRAAHSTGACSPTAAAGAHPSWLSAAATGWDPAPEATSAYSPVPLHSTGTAAVWPRPSLRHLRRLGPRTEVPRAQWYSISSLTSEVFPHSQATAKAPASIRAGTWVAQRIPRVRVADRVPDRVHGEGGRALRSAACSSFAAAVSGSVIASACKRRPIWSWSLARCSQLCLGQESSSSRACPRAFSRRRTLRGGYRPNCAVIEFDGGAAGVRARASAVRHARGAPRHRPVRRPRCSSRPKYSQQRDTS